MKIGDAARLMGKKGGKARAKALSQEELQAIARKGVRARKKKLGPERVAEIARENGRKGGRPKKKP